MQLSLTARGLVFWEGSARCLVPSAQKSLQRRGDFCGRKICVTENAFYRIRVPSAFLRIRTIACGALAVLIVAGPIWYGATMRKRNWRKTAAAAAGKHLPGSAAATPAP